MSRIDGDLSTIRVLYRRDDSLTLYGIPYDMRADIGQSPHHLHEKYRASWIYLGEPGWWGSLSESRIAEIKAFLAKHADLVPHGPHEWSKLP